MSNPPRNISRRQLIRAAAVAGTYLTVPGVASGETPAPRVLHAIRGAAHLRGPDLPPTAIWSFNGAVPGETIRARPGDDLKVRLTNGLDVPMGIHWHGVRVPNAMDGMPPLTQPAVVPGGSFGYRFKAPDAGTFWYHCDLGVGGELARGLHGALIIEEPQPVDVDRDFVLVVSTWPLTADGTLGDPAAGGEFWTVNGLPAVDLPVRTNERLRLRLVNATPTRLMSLRLERHDAVVVAIDGEPAEPFMARDGHVTLSPGNRIDLFVDAVLEAGASAALLADDAVPIARLAYDAGPPARPAPRGDVGALPPNPLPGQMDFKNALKLDIPLGAEPGRLGDAPSSSPLFSVKQGRAVMLGLVNRSSAARVVHVHGHHFRLLDPLDDGWKPFWLDTVLVADQQTVRIAFVADNPGKWLLDGAEASQGGPPRWFEVV